MPCCGSGFGDSLYNSCVVLKRHNSFLLLTYLDFKDLSASTTITSIAADQHQHSAATNSIDLKKHTQYLEINIATSIAPSYFETKLLVATRSLRPATMTSSYTSFATASFALLTASSSKSQLPFSLFHNSSSSINYSNTTSIASLNSSKPKPVPKDPK